MAVLEGVAPAQRIGAGLLFLFIALGVLVVQPAGPTVSGILAGINLLMSAAFLLTVGRDTTAEPTYDVGFWLLAVVVALAMYLGTGLLIAGEVDIFQLLVFIIGFGLVLGILAELRHRLTA